MLVTVTAFRDPWEAHLFRGRLLAEGVNASVAHEMHVANKWPLSVALGGVKVQVPYDEIETARAIERACRQGEFEEVLRAELGDLDDAVCPHCGGVDYRKRRPLPRAALAVLFSLYAGSVFPPVGWIYRCESCSREYRAPHLPFRPRKWAQVAAVMVLLVLAEMALLHWIHKVFFCPHAGGCF